MAKLKKRIAGEANRRTREILREPVWRGCKDMGPFGAVSSMGKPTTTTGGTPRRKECILKTGEWENFFSRRCLGGNAGRSLIFGARSDAIGVLSLLFAGEREGGGN